MAAEGNKITISIGIDVGWLYQHVKFYDIPFKRIVRKRGETWKCGEQINGWTDNDTHKPKWQPHFSNVIWPQYPNPSPCTVGRTDEHMKWQQYHQHQCRMMVKHLDTSACQMLCHFFKVICQRNCSTKQMLQNGRKLEIQWSMSYPCLMTPIMSSSTRFELKLFSGLPANAPRPERVTNRQTDRRMYQWTRVFLYHVYPSQLIWGQNGVSNIFFLNDKKSQFLWWCDLDLWHMIMKSWSVRGTITTIVCTKFDNNPSSAFWVIAWTMCAEGGLNIKP